MGLVATPPTPGTSMRISVIIPVYNRASLIGSTLDSLRTQTLPPKEIVVVDDGSTDDTPGMVERYAGKFPEAGLRLVRQENAGPSAARNRGLALAQGDLLAWCDADDLWLPRKLEKQVQRLGEDPQAAGVYCRMFKFQSDLDDLGRPEPQNMIEPPAGIPGVEHILLTMCIQSSTAVVRRSAIEGLKFDEDLRAAEDALFFAEVGLRGRWLMVDEPLVAYRVHEVQLTKEAWHGVKTTEARVAWCRAQASRIGPAAAAAWEERLWRHLIEGVEKLYWQRNFAGLKSLRNHLAQACPELYAQSILARKHLWPRWVYRLRDLVS